MGVETAGAISTDTVQYQLYGWRGYKTFHAIANAYVSKRLERHKFLLKDIMMFFKIFTSIFILRYY
jgi:hypothetical protein